MFASSSKVIPLQSSVASHVMSVFTFMGSGLFRKDNELTLGIIEDTIEALFRAVCEEDGKVGFLVFGIWIQNFCGSVFSRCPTRCDCGLLALREFSPSLHAIFPPIVEPVWRMR